MWNSVTLLMDTVGAQSDVFNSFLYPHFNDKTDKNNKHWKDENMTI